MAPSNAAILTRQSKAWAQKKRARQGQIKEIVFDEDARRDYLTGFQKRNTEKKKAAKAKAMERQKAEHLEERRQARKELKERARTNFEAVEKAYGGAALEMLEDESTKPEGNEHEDEYSDEEQLATVAVIEDFDPTADMHGSREEREEEEGGEPEKLSKPKSKVSSTLAKRSSKPKSPARKVRYETKAAARAAHAKALSQRRGKKVDRISKKKSKHAKR